MASHRLLGTLRGPEPRLLTEIEGEREPLDAGGGIESTKESVCCLLTFSWDYLGLVAEQAGYEKIGVAQKINSGKDGKGSFVESRFALVLETTSSLRCRNLLLRRYLTAQDG